MCSFFLGGVGGGVLCYFIFCVNVQGSMFQVSKCFPGKFVCYFSVYFVFVCPGFFSEKVKNGKG